MSSQIKTFTRAKVPESFTRLISYSFQICKIAEMVCSLLLTAKIGSRYFLRWLGLYTDYVIIYYKKIQESGSASKRLEISSRQMAGDKISIQTRQRVRWGSRKSHKIWETVSSVSGYSVSAITGWPKFTLSDRFVQLALIQ